MVRWKGFEPLTFWFVVRHSIQLSYQRISFATVLCGARNILSDSLSIVNAFFKFFWIFFAGPNLPLFGRSVTDQKACSYRSKNKVPGIGWRAFSGFLGHIPLEKGWKFGFSPFFHTFSLFVCRGSVVSKQTAVILCRMKKYVFQSHTNSALMLLY